MRDETIEAMIREAGWFKGSERDWRALPREEQKDLAFAGCGCEAAYATWSGPVKCVHTDCQARRGEIKPMVAMNRALRSEIRSGWLRFDKTSPEGRSRLARIVRGFRNRAAETGIYDPWSIPGGWHAMVGSALS